VVKRCILPPLRTGRPVPAALLCSCFDPSRCASKAAATLRTGCPPDYRWLLDRDDSPWYPTMRLFRQTDTRDYASVLDRVRSELLKLISAK
jgi:hypothetical protein